MQFALRILLETLLTRTDSRIGGKEEKHTLQQKSNILCFVFVLFVHTKIHCRSETCFCHIFSFSFIFYAHDAVAALYAMTMCLSISHMPESYGNG